MMETLIGLVKDLAGPWPYLIVFGILLACGLGVPIPEDITLFVGGMMSYYGNSNVWLMILTGMIGVLLGDSIIFLLGAKYGHRLTQNRFFAKTLTPERLEKVEEKLKKQGNKVVFAARFMPGLRAPIYFSSGALGLPFRVFLFYDGLAALLSVPAIVYSVYYFGSEVDYIVGLIQKIEHGIVFLIIGIVLIVFFKSYLKKRVKSQ